MQVTNPPKEVCQLPTPLITSSGINVLMLLMLLFLMINNTIISAQKRTAYVTAIMLTIAVISAEVSAAIFDGMGQGFYIPNILANIAGFSLSPFIPIFLAAVFDETLLHQVKYYCIPIWANFVLILSSPWTGWVFSVSAQNQYSRGPFFGVYIATYLFALLILMRSNHRQFRQYQASERHFLMILYSIFFIGTTLQLLFPFIHASWHCITLILVMYYLFQRELQFKYDILTNVLNRYAFEKSMDQLNGVDNTGIILFDLDRFKEINDQFGHAKGDYYLKVAASMIDSSFKQVGHCYRIGGDEFCVLASNTSEPDIKECIEEMLKTNQTAKAADSSVPAISYGYCIYGKDKHTDILHAFQEADKRMYWHKQAVKDVSHGSAVPHSPEPSRVT